MSDENFSDVSIDLENEALGGGHFRRMGSPAYGNFAKKISMYSSVFTTRC